MSMNQSCALAVMMANGILDCDNRITVSRLREVTILFYPAFVGLHL